MKYLGINVSKDVKDLYSKNYETLKKESKEDTNKWKAILCSYTGRTDIFTMSSQNNNALSKDQWHSSQH